VERPRTPAIPIRDTPHGATFAIRVHPGAKKTAITGIYGQGDSAALKLSLAAPPLEGRANQAAIEFFASLLKIPNSQVQILTGEKSRSKIIRIETRTAKEITAAIHSLTAS
jgi:uncharacterized protein (TIGR00251 family)